MFTELPIAGGPGAYYSDSMWLGPALAIVSARTVNFGMSLARRMAGPRG